MIKYFNPYSTSKDLGADYNESMSLLPSSEDWGVFIDGDAIFTTHFWGKQVEDIIKEHPDVEIFTAVTNRVGTDYQCVEGTWDVQDMETHWKIGAILQQKNGTNLVDITHQAPFSGVFMAVKKSAWEKVGGFKSGIGMLGVDNSLHTRAVAKGIKVWMATSIYLFHYYRNGVRENKQHLL